MKIKQKMSYLSKVPNFEFFFKCLLLLILCDRFGEKYFSIFIAVMSGPAKQFRIVSGLIPNTSKLTQKQLLPSAKCFQDTEKMDRIAVNQSKSRELSP